MRAQFICSRAALGKCLAMEVSELLWNAFCYWGLSTFLEALHRAKMLIAGRGMYPKVAAAVHLRSILQGEGIRRKYLESLPFAANCKLLFHVFVMRSLKPSCSHLETMEIVDATAFQRLRMRGCWGEGLATSCWHVHSQHRLGGFNNAKPDVLASHGLLASLAPGVDPSALVTCSLALG